MFNSEHGDYNMTTLNIHSNGLIYAPGFFRWVMAGNKTHQRKFLAALGIPSDLVKPIMQGKYTSREDGETLILTVEA